jgi:ABC-type amino acid transport system permease subunit
MLPEKYSYFRRVQTSSLQIVGADETTVVDCVICMASVDMTQQSTECMVQSTDHLIIFCDCLPYYACLLMLISLQMKSVERKYLYSL